MAHATYFCHLKTLTATKLFVGYFNYEFVFREGYKRLLHQGYEYVSPVADATQTLRLWRCCRSQYQSQICSASAVLEQGGQLTLLGTHNHLPAKIFHEGYEYLFEKMEKGKMKLYRCNWYLSSTTTCTARAIVTDVGDLTLVGEHSHCPGQMPS